MSKQTAVDFLAAEQADLFLQFTNKKISLSEYAVNITNAHKQAKDFFREQIDETFKHAQVLHAVSDETRAEQYYTQTFNQEK